MKYLSQHLHDVASGLQFSDVVISHGRTQLSHRADDIAGQALNVHGTVLGLLPNELCVQNFTDLVAKPVATRS